MLATGIASCKSKVALGLNVSSSWNRVGFGRNTNHLTSAVEEDGEGNVLTQVTYTYDALGNRISETATDAIGNPSTTQFAYDPSGQLVAEMAASGAWTTYLADQQDTNQFLARVDGSGVSWLLTDRQGSVTVALSPDGSQGLAQATYDAFGNQTIVSGTATDLGRLGFQGGMMDSATGLVHFGARDYDPTNGRWTTPDPANADVNTYRGMGNDPTNQSDPDGMAVRVNKRGTADETDVAKARSLLPAFIAAGKAKAGADRVFLGVYDIDVTGTDVVAGGVTTHNVTNNAHFSYLSNVIKDQAGELVVGGGYAKAKTTIEDIAKTQGVAVRDTGGGTIRTTLQDDTRLVLHRDGDWGDIIISRPGEGAIRVKAKNSIRELNIRAPNGDNNNIDRLDIDPKTGGFIVVEEKNAAGLANPKNRQTEAQWAKRHVFDEIKARLDLITRTVNPADQTFKSTGKAVPYVGPDTPPNIKEIRNIKHYVIEIKTGTPKLRTAVDAEINNLKRTFPGYQFEAVYSGP
jgi:RHS repeat-associated protein